MLTYENFIEGKIELLQDTIEPPTYDAFLSKETQTSEEQLHIIEAPSYAWFIGNDDSSFDEPDEQPTLKNNNTAKVKDKPEKDASKIGNAMAIIAAILATAGIAVSVVGASYVAWFMFIGGALALILSIVGERLNRNNSSKWPIRAVMYSVFSLVTPVLLYLIGWLSV